MDLTEQLTYAQKLIQQQHQIIKNQEELIQSLTENEKQLQKQFREEGNKFTEELRIRDSALQELVTLLKSHNLPIPDTALNLLESKKIQ
jgi:hypothetical protein